jgi:hypothetical protein
MIIDDKDTNTNKRLHRIQEKETGRRNGREKVARARQGEGERERGRESRPYIRKRTKPDKTVVILKPAACAIASFLPGHVLSISS